MATVTTPPVIVDARRGPSLLIRILWFVFIGWWASFLVINLAVLASLTIVGIPLAIWLENRIPQVVTLKLDRNRLQTATDADGNTVVTVLDVAQRPFWQRALWFLLIGWWLTAIWLNLAWLLCLVVVGMPLAFPMFNATGKLLTLKRG